MSELQSWENPLPILAWPSPELHNKKSWRYPDSRGVCFFIEPYPKKIILPSHRQRMISSFLLLVLAVVVGAGPPSAVVVVDAVAVMVAPCRPGAGSACARQEAAPGAPACCKQGVDPWSRQQLLTRSQVRSQSGGDEVWTLIKYWTQVLIVVKKIFDVDIIAIPLFQEHIIFIEKIFFW